MSTYEINVTFVYTFVTNIVINGVTKIKMNERVNKETEQRVHDVSVTACYLL